MAAATGRSIGRQIDLLMTTVHSDTKGLRGVVDHTEVQAELINVDTRSDKGTGTASTDANISVITDVTDIGSNEATRDVTEYSTFGASRVKKLAAQVNTADFTFDVAFNAADDYHSAILAAPGAVTVAQTFVLRVTTNTSGSQRSWIFLDGIITSASVAPAIDGVTTMSVTVSPVKGPTQIDNS